MTPYVAGSPNPNPAGTIESQAVVPGRVNFSIKAKGLKRPKGNVLISGKVLVDGKAAGGTAVQIFRVPNLNKPIKTVRTKANGTFSFRKKFAKKDRALRDRGEGRVSRSLSGGSVARRSGRLPDGDALLRRRRVLHGQAAQTTLKTDGRTGPLDRPRPPVSWP